MHEVWLYVHAGFATKDIDSDIIDPKAPGTPFSKLPSPEKVFSRMLKGTDIAITIDAATENQELIQAVRKAFESFPLEQ